LLSNNGSDETEEEVIIMGQQQATANRRWVFPKLLFLLFFRALFPPIIALVLTNTAHGIMYYILFFCTSWAYNFIKWRGNSLSITIRTFQKTNWYITSVGYRKALVELLIGECIILYTEAWRDEESGECDCFTYLG
jgi:hypothetical protein